MKTAFLTLLFCVAMVAVGFADTANDQQCVVKESVVAEHPQVVIYWWPPHSRRSEATNGAYVHVMGRWSYKPYFHPTEVRYLQPDHWECIDGKCQWVEVHWGKQPYRY